MTGKYLSAEIARIPACVILFAIQLMVEFSLGLQTRHSITRLNCTFLATIFPHLKSTIRTVSGLINPSEIHLPSIQLTRVVCRRARILLLLEACMLISINGIKISWLNCVNVYKPSSSSSSRVLFVFISSL
jgi:hypothetical protein